MSNSKLQTALNEFQQNLSPDQSNQYSLAISTTPTPGDVLLLTDEINKKHSSRKSRVHSDRLRIVLECVQQWSSVVDTLVQVNQIAALVWGSVKVVVRIALNFADYFEKLSKRFAQLSIYCPRLEEYERLFPSSTRLQNALSDFYAIMVMFCTQALQVFSEKGVKRLVKSFGKPFKDDFQLLEENLSVAKEEVDREIDLASDQKLDQIYKRQQVEIEKSQLQRLQYLSEAEENKNFRSQQTIALAESKELRIQKNIKEEERRKIRLHQRIFCYDYSWSLRKAARVRCDNTGFWLFEREEFKEWGEERVSNCLWLSGITGCGKTVLAGLTVKQLEKTLSSDEATFIAYYFFDPIQKESLSTFTFLRSLLHQLIRVETLAPPILNALETMFIGPNGERAPDIEELESLITQLCDPQKRIVIIIDGIGEVEQNNRRVVLRFLKTLQQCAFVKLFISSQLDVDIRMFFNNCQVTQINVKPHDLDSDIRVFIENQIGKECQVGFLSTCLPDLIDHIKQKLALKAKAMFLWVELQIKAICDACEEAYELGQSHENIPELLNNLPEGILDTYLHLVQRVLNGNGGRIETVIKIFQWVVFAKRPLTIDELEEAISITSEQKSWKQPSEKLRSSLVSRMCGNLIVVDEYDSTVLPAHHTVISFLVSHVRPLTKLHLHIREGDSYLGETCITYLNFVDFQKSLANTRDTRYLRCMNDPTNLVAQVFPRSFLLKSIGLGKWTNHEQRLRNNRAFDAENQLRTLMSMVNPSRPDCSFQLLDYCRINWHHHCRSFLSNESKYPILKKLITEIQLPFSWQPWDPVDDLDPFPNWQIFSWAIRNSHRPILQVWQDSTAQNDQLNSWKLLLSTREDNLFLSACNTSDSEQIDILLSWPKTKFEPSESLISAGLACAAALGYIEIVERLLQEKVGVIALRRQKDLSALHAAAKNGHLGIVERLLQENVDVIGTENGNRETTLQAAAKNGHTAVVERLIQYGAEVNAGIAGFDGRTALQAAAEGGHLIIVELLLQKKADVNAAPAKHYGRTALQAASEGGHLIVVERLLRKNANVNAPAGEYNGRTALQAAAENGHLTVVERLLQRGAQVNAKPAFYTGRTALQAAAENGHLTVLGRLLQQYADVNADASDTNGRTALQAAAGNGHLAVVERLLQQGAYVNANLSFNGGRSALQAAAENGHLAVVDRLLQQNANVNTPASPYKGLTALQAARHYGHVEVEKRLRAAGAKL